MAEGSRRLRALLLVGVAVLAAGAGLLAAATNVVRRPELLSVDARFDVRGKHKPPRDVVLVGLDAQSLQELKARSPIPRRHHARVIDRLRAAGARVIAYDFEFVTPTTTADDNALITALTRAGNVVLATTKVDGRRAVVLGGPGGAARANAVAGLASLPPSATRGGAIRRLPYEDLGVRIFSVVAAERALGRPLPRSRFDGDGAWIDFAGKPGTIPAIPFAAVAAGRVPAERFRGRTVVVGATDPIIQDVETTATGEMAGPETNVNAIATLLGDFPLRDPASAVSWLLIALAGAITPLAALRWRGLKWLPVAPLFAVGYAVAAQLAFNAGTIVPLAAPALALLLGFLGTLSVAWATDLRDRRRLRQAFARFVPEQVVDEVVAQSGGVRLGGTLKTATVVFCDLRGFTSVAEHLAPERVIDLLNHYLTEMSDAILDAGGTVVAYMGDGIMAVFGAPLDQPDHADRALQAAREMLGERIDKVNAYARETSLDATLKMGIGICTGPVMSGNVGSTRRLEYTAVGDTTNTAARLEGMTKDAGCPVLIADSTRDAITGEPPALRCVGDLPVRGRSATLTAWTFEDA